MQIINAIVLEFVIFLFTAYVTGHEKRYHLALIIISEYSVKCDVAGENRPTGAYFIIEFDLTKVVTGIFGRKFSYDILLYRRLAYM